MKSASQMLIVFAIAATIMIPFSSCTKDESNHAPEITYFNMDPSTVTANGISMVRVRATDSDKDAITYSYAVSGGSESHDGLASYWTAPSEPGSYTVTATVTDEHGLTDIQEGTLVVTEASTQICGMAKFAEGTSGNLNLSGTKVFLKDYITGALIKTTTLSGGGLSAVFNITGLSAGKYQLLVWNDIDNSGDESLGDYFGWYGSGPLLGPDIWPIDLVEGQSFSCDITVYHAAK